MTDGWIGGRRLFLENGRPGAWLRCRHLSPTGFSPGLPGLLALVILGFCIWADAAAARNLRLVVEVGKGVQLVDTDEAETLFVADPNVADLSASPGEAHFVYGKQPGETTLIGVDIAGKTLFQYDVIVVHNLEEVQRMLAQRFPGARITIQSARGSIFARGIVSDERTYEAVIESLKSSIPDTVLIDEIAVAQGRIIRLDVKLLEVARDQLETYGVNWSVLASSSEGGICNARCSSIEVNALVKLLLENGVATILSETSLTTIGNKKASLMVGEEIAVPSYAAREGMEEPNFGVEYRFVGLNVGFTPNLVPGGKVNLAIESEISSLRDAAQFISGNRIPNIASRKLDTSVELNDGESFILAGLSRLDTSAALEKPRRNWGFIGELSRKLFGHDEIAIRHRDLIVVVTPHFGASDRPSIAEAVDLQQSNLEYVLALKAKKHGKPAAAHIYGPAGFLY